MAGVKWRAIGKWTAWALLVVVVAYPLSYAPVVRWKLDGPTAQGYFYPLIVDGADYPVYKPVDWLIDNTPLDRPLFAWASRWGVGDQFRSSAGMREFGRQMRGLKQVRSRILRDHQHKAHPLQTPVTGTLPVEGITRYL